MAAGKLGRYQFSVNNILSNEVTISKTSSSTSCFASKLKKWRDNAYNSG
jgi:hypothetical protein